MTEVTRVPLQPIAKGSLTKLWLGVIVAVLIGAGVAWAAAPKGIDFDVLVEGTGGGPNVGDVAFVKYTGTLPDGSEFDKWEAPPIPPGILPEGYPMLLEEGQQVQGFYEALLQMEEGGKYKVVIPPELGYGDAPPPGIPAGTDLTFEVEIVKFMSRQDVEAKMAALQQAIQAQQEAQAGAGGPPGQAGPPNGPRAPMPPQN